jgi:DNA-binding GntR family transcriptional regulator
MTRDSELLSGSVYEAIRHAIIRGELRPNQRLVEAALASRFNVSRTPIRESLQRLVAEGLAESQRAGWIVHEHTPLEIKQISEVRAALESHAARLSAQRRSEAQLRRIAKMLEESRGLTVLPPSKTVELNERFHDAIIMAAGNPFLADMIKRSNLFHFNYPLAALYDKDELAESHQQHIRMFESIRDKNPEAAALAVLDHVNLTVRTVLAKIA